MEVMDRKQVETKKLIVNYINSQSYQPEFKHFMIDMLEQYGVEMFNISGIGEQLDINHAVKKIANAHTTAGGTIDGNANVGAITAGGLLQEINKPHLLIQSYYRIWKWLKKNRGIAMANTFVEKQINGAIYMNDMHYIVGCISYCFNHSVMNIVNQGLTGIDSKGDALPPKHLRSYFDQIEAYLLIAGSNTAGATGISGLLVGASIFMDKILKTGKDGHTTIGDPWQYLKEELGSLIYRLNQPARHSQSLFTNVSVFDDYFLEEMLPDYFAIIDDEVYRAELDTVKRVQQVYLDVMREEGRRRVLTFPVTTACFSIDKTEEGTTLKDYNFLEQICKANEETAYINIFAGETSTLSSCCRLQSDKANKFFNSLGGASDAIGSFGVVSVNLPRIAYNHKGDMDGFMKELEEVSYLAQECNYAKRCLLKNTIEKGHAPLYTNGYMSLKKQFSTLGFVGLYEACEIMGYDITKYDGMEVGKTILGKMSEVINNVQEKYKMACNLEGVPAEGLAPKFAKKDKLLNLNESYDLYANQFVPLHKRCNMLQRIQLQAEYDKYCSGGSILHLNVDQKIDVDKMKNLVEAVIKTGTKYFALNYNIYQCNDCNGITVGTTSACEHCQSENIDRFLRVVGFITKVKDWIPSRATEDRQFYNV